MDRNTLVGFILIGLIFLGFYLINPSDQANKQERQRENIETQQQIENNVREAEKALLENNISDSTQVDSLQLIAAREGQFGAFAAASLGDEAELKVETELLNLTFANKGGRISAVELKKYKTHDSLPLFLFDGAKEGTYDFTLVTANSRIVNTTDLYFQMLPVEKNDSAQIVTMRLPAGEGAYLDFRYTLPHDNYMLKFDIIPVGMKNVLAPNTRDLEMQWFGKIRQQEKGRDFENRYSGLFYKHLTDDVENLSESKSERKRIETSLKWIAFKDQFFSSILIADEALMSTQLESAMNNSSTHLKDFYAKSYVPFNEDGAGFSFYFGPNHYKTLRSYDKGVSAKEKLDIEKLVPLGWTLFRWVNQLLIIPMFNFFGRFISNYGIIILLMTIVIKIIIFPLTYKSYMSSAKMRVLKPEIEKINARIPADKPQERQKATMDLYSRVGVSPMGGCLPMLLQMPILIAMFSFFPSSIELRQQSFLWAEDLSTYDSILTLPFTIPFYGNHVSLFCLLMTVVNIIYTKINMASQDTGGQQMPGMKTMMYLMPVMFLFFFNNYASGLSYYYLVSLLITIIQTYAIRASVDEEKLLKQLHENKKKPAKKTGFLARMEEAQRKQLEAQKKQAKGKK